MDRPYGLFGHIKLWTIVNGGLLICKIGILTVSTATGVGRSNGLRHIRKRRCFHWKYHTFVSLESVWIQYMWKWYHVCFFFKSFLENLKDFTKFVFSEVHTAIFLWWELTIFSWENKIFIQKTKHCLSTAFQNIKKVYEMTLSLTICQKIFFSPPN